VVDFGRVRTCVIFNPTAKGDKARNFRKRLNELSGDVEFKATTHAGAGRELAKAAVDEGFETVVAAGGDGTINEVLNGIGDAENGFARARLGVIPLGTINVFALEVGIPFDIAKAWKIIQTANERGIDLPTATFRIGEKSVSRHFLQMAGAGWDARAVELVSWKLKKRIGRLAYIWAGFGALRPPKSPVLVESDNEKAEGDFALISNGRFYAGKFPFLFRADLSDGLLDVTVFPKFQWASLAGCLTNFILGRYFRPGIQPYFHANKVDVHSKAVTPLQLDGDLVGHLPATISVAPKALRVIVP
jgi:diacylglycerol kinase (ATP)